MMEFESWYRYTLEDKHISIALPDTWTLMETAPEHVEEFTSLFLEKQAEIFPFISENRQPVQLQLEYILQNLETMKVDLFALQVLGDEENKVHFSDITISTFPYQKAYSSIHSIEELLKKKESGVYKLHSIEELPFSIGNVIHVRGFTEIEHADEQLTLCTNQFLIPMLEQQHVYSITFSALNIDDAMAFEPSFFQIINTFQLV
ncbi:hypothetical protein ACO11K_000584 [Bacillus cytotoxicus]|nr:hypothetical protein [Bacillus cytotoxicus]EMA6345348.1 hypothetical protein [Bacillus cytotoxicus]